MRNNWLSIAKHELGVSEYGEETKNNPRIIQYHDVTSLKARSDKTPWCASFVSWCLEQAGVKSARTARARNYLKWGMQITDPIPGCIAVFSRGKASGHVAFFIKEDGDSIIVLGGNQSDMVCERAYPKSRLLGYRWPNDYPIS